MKKALLAFLAYATLGSFFFACTSSEAVAPPTAEDGYRLWLRYEPLLSLSKPYSEAIRQIVVPGDTETCRAIGRELASGVNAMLGSSLKVDPEWAGKPAPRFRPRMSSMCPNHPLPRRTSS